MRGNRTIKKISDIEDGPRLEFVPVTTDPENPGTIGGHEIVPTPKLGDICPRPGATPISQPASLQSATLPPASVQCENQAVPDKNEHTVVRCGDIASAVGVSAFVHGIASTALHSVKAYRLGIQEFLVLGALLKSQPQTLISLKTVLVGHACTPSRAFKNLASCGLAQKGPAVRGRAGRFTVVPTRKGRRVFVQLEKRIAFRLEDALKERRNGDQDTHVKQMLLGTLGLPLLL